VLSVDKPSVGPGGELLVAGAGCDAGAPVTLTLEGQLVGNTVADANGAFKTPVSVGNASVGRHVLTAKCGPTLTTTIDVVLASKVIQGGAASIVIVLFLLVALGFVIAQFDTGREV